MAAGLFILTIVMGAGIVTVSAASFVPTIKGAFDSRIPIGQTLSDVIASGGIDQAIGRYHQLKAASPKLYNFDEDQLNNLGYELVRAKKFDQAIRIFQLNVEAYPQSPNVYDSLGEGYMDAGDKPQAIANYQRSLQLNPKSTGAVKMLQLLQK
jgi:predicted Zn-dependent protease